MKLCDVSDKLREMSEKYGGIKHFLTAADQLDRAIGAYFVAQDEESLRVLVGAHAHAAALSKQITPLKDAV